MTTATAKSNKFSLEQLRQQIRDLPEKRKRAERIENVRQFVLKLREHHRRLEQTLRGRQHAPQVFDAIPLSKVDDQVRLAARAGRALRKRLTEDSARVSDPATSNKVADIGTHSQAAERALAEQWAAQVISVVDRFEKLVVALERLRLTQAGLLAQALQRLRENAARPPYAPDRSASLRADVDALSDSIAKLGLTGAVGQFLTKAADRSAGADPRDLFTKPEVKEFFDKNDLWAMLAVCFRA